MPAEQSAALSHAATFNLEEAAAYFRVSKATVYRMMRGDNLPSSKIGRRTIIRRVDCDRIIEQGARPPRVAPPASILLPASPARRGAVPRQQTTRMPAAARGRTAPASAPDLFG